jgi:hypothetical protein
LATLSKILSKLQDIFVVGIEEILKGGNQGFALSSAVIRVENVAEGAGVEGQQHHGWQRIL